MTETPTPTTRNILARGQKRIVEDELMRLAAKPGFKDRTRADILAEIVGGDHGFNITMGNLEGAAKAMGVELPTSRPAPATNEDRELLQRVATLLDAFTAEDGDSVEWAEAQLAWRAYRAKTGGPLFATEAERSGK